MWEENTGPSWPFKVGWEAIGEGLVEEWHLISTLKDYFCAMLKIIHGFVEAQRKTGFVRNKKRLLKLFIFCFKIIFLLISER